MSAGPLVAPLTGRSALGPGRTPGAYQGIVTGEAVALDLRVAGLPSRVLAGVIDLGVIYGGGSIVLSYVIGLLATQLDGALLAAVAIALYVALVLGYPVVLQVFNRGRTVGKLVVGLRVVRDDGGPVAFRQAFTRELIGIVVEKPGLLIFLPAVLCSLLREDGKRIGDLAAGTVVISDRIAHVGHDTRGPLMPPPLAGWAAGLDLSRLPDAVALRGREVLTRAETLRPAAREALGAELVAAFTAAVGPPPPGTPGWAFLAAVLAERRRRDLERVAAARHHAAARAAARSGSGISAVGMAAYDRPGGA